MADRYSTGAGFTLEQHPITNVSTNYTVVAQDVLVLVDASSGAITITLPVAATGDLGKSFYFRKTDSSANTVTIEPNAGDSTINGGSSIILDTQLMSAEIQSLTGTTWFGNLEGPGARAASEVKWVTKTGNYTIVAGDSGIEVDATSGAVTITLPTAASSNGKVFHIKKTDSTANKVTIDPDGSETIDGQTTLDILWQYDSVMAASDGTEWWVI